MDLNLHPKSEKLETVNLGIGEISSFKLHKKVKGTIVTDDNTFINFLKRENAEFMIPADFITLMKKLKKKSRKIQVVIFIFIVPLLLPCHILE